MKKERRMKIAALALAALLPLTGCMTQSEELDPTAAPNATPTLAVTQTAAGVLAGLGVTPSDVPAGDLDSAWQEADATKITLNDAATTVDGAGAKANGAVVTIGAAGTYVVSGTLSDGQIAIAATNADTVRLVLNGADITNKSGAAIYASQCEKLILTLADGTENIVTDGGSAYVYADETEQEPNAAVFSKDDLTINGTGSLTVNAGFNNGIGTKDDLCIVSGKLSITAANHGLRGNDSVTTLGGDIAITAGDDGIHASNDQEADKGGVEIQNGVFRITSAHDGIQAANGLVIFGGEFDIKTGGGSANAPKREEDFRSGWGGGTGAQTQTTTQESSSMKALKAGKQLYILDGAFVIDSEDDALHSNGDAAISGGTFNIAAGDDGIHADAALQIAGGTIRIPTCYEGLEGLCVSIAGGEIAVEASDDAVNAAGGVADATEIGGPMGEDRFASDGERFVRVSGGILDLYAPRDGIDSNGDIFLDGGTVKISGPSQGMEGAIDLDGNFVVTGGELITAGSIIRPSTDSTQAVLLVSYVAQQTSGSTIAIRDASGNTLLEYTSKMAYSLSGFTSPAFQVGETLSLFIDGEKKTEIVLSDTITSIAEDGGAYSGMGGGGNWGAGAPPGGGGGGRPNGGGFPAFDGMDEEMMRAAMEIIRQAQGAQLTQEQKEALLDIGLTEDQITQMQGMIGRRGGMGGRGGTPPEGQTGAWPAGQPGGQPAGAPEAQ